jgi:hypothetical protein
LLTGPVIDGDGDGDVVAVGDVDGGKESDGDVTGVVEEVAELGGVLTGAPLADRVLVADDVAD